MNGLSTINIELTSRCNKGDGTLGSGCFMCGRRKLEREHPEMCNWGDMPIAMFQKIAKQIPSRTVVQLHNNGEPLLYPNLYDVIDALKRKGCFVSLNTNGKLLWEKREDVCWLDTLVVSVIERDPEGEEQLEVLRRYNTWYGHKPRVILRFLGDVDQSKYGGIEALHVSRMLHSPDGSRGYQKPVTIPEIGVCLDLLTHLAVDRYGNVSMCVRFDPEGELRIGNIADMTLHQAWDSEKRDMYIANHTRGERWLCPGCDKCEYWGVPHD